MPAQDPDKRPSIPIAYVPEIFFFPYSNPHLYWDSSDYEKIKKRILREAERFGWTWGHPIAGRERAEHEYFSVVYGGID
jgi:hypothetical protein